MKALLVAAGRGTRLGALTEHLPKPMLPIAGVPMIERIMIGIASAAGITEFVLVVGYLGDVVRRHFGNGDTWGWQVDYVEQDMPRGLGHALLCARDLLQDGHFLMTYGDIMIDPVNYASAVETYNTVLPDAVLGLNWVEDPWAGAAVYVDSRYRVERLDEKPARGTATTHWNNAGLFVFRPHIFEYAEKLTPSPRGEYELPDAVTAMIRDGFHVQGLPLAGAWRDVGTPLDYATVNEEYAGR